MNNKKQFLSALLFVTVFSMHASEPVDWGDPCALDYASCENHKKPSVICSCATTECDGICDEIANLEKLGDEYAKGYLQAGCCGCMTVLSLGVAAAIYAFGNSEL